MVNIGIGLVHSERLVAIARGLNGPSGSIITNMQMLDVTDP